VPTNKEFSMTEHIVAVFETVAAADAVTDSLRRAGIPPSAIRQDAGAEVAQKPLPTEQTSAHTSGGGFWAWLLGEDTSASTTRTSYTGDHYDRRASAGNVVVSVTVDDDSRIRDAIAALEAHSPVDIDEQSDDLNDGKGTSAIAPVPGSSTAEHEYSGGAAGRSGMVAAVQPSGPAAMQGRPPVPASGTSAGLPGDGGTRVVRQDEQVIPLSEEQIEVGKRTVDRGVTRVRRYVVETPVEESVTLRGERVTVERRRPVEATADSGAGAFEERTVEVHETAEEPVVAKKARVAEEVVVGREATERTETVRDTVRREEVEVANDAGVRRPD
jgi:uncharacterized protein (TIGR02271 family)